MMNTVDLVASKINNERYSKKEFTKWFHLNPLVILYITISQVDSRYDYVCGP